MADQRAVAIAAGGWPVRSDACLLPVLLELRLVLELRSLQCCVMHAMGNVSSILQHKFLQHARAACWLDSRHHTGFGACIELPRDGAIQNLWY